MRCSKNPLARMNCRMATSAFMMEMLVWIAVLLRKTAKKSDALLCECMR